MLYVLIDGRMRARAYAHAHTHTRMHAHTRAHTHTLVVTVYLLALSPCPLKACQVTTVEHQSIARSNLCMIAFSILSLYIATSYMPLVPLILLNPLK